MRGVPAIICTLCGKEWIDLHTAQELERIVEDTKICRHQLGVLAFSEVNLALTPTG